MSFIGLRICLIALIVLQGEITATAQVLTSRNSFRAIAFFTAKHDPAHISFVREANRWFGQQALKNDFRYDTTSAWTNLNRKFLSGYDVIIFLDTRPEQPDQRQAFREFMEDGGAWLGFHFAAFSLDKSAYPDNWSWYHDEFLGSGQYQSNTWKPTAETLYVHAPSHPVCLGVDSTFVSAPNEWYRWENDLRNNVDIEIILSLDASTFPVGTGPKQHEIWHEGFYPVAWSNRKFRMVYVNMGHNDIDYDGGTNRELSSTFSSEMQSKFILQTLLWLGRK